MDYLYIDQPKQKPESLRPYDFHQIYLFVSKHQNELIDPKIYGWIQVSNMYLSEQDFFRVNYGEEDLIIENTGEYYIPFEDPLTCKMAANIWGDMVGVTESRATLFTGNEITRTKTQVYDQITTFDEFKYFNKIKEIPKQAFYAFHNLTHINCPPSLKTIGEQAFYQCDHLSSFGNLSNIESIGANAFRDTLLSEFSSNNIQTINGNCFRNTQLTTCHIDGSFTTLPYDAFRYCILLESVTGMSNVTNIESEAFYDCQVLTSVPTEYVTTIGNTAFYHCYALEELNTPNLTNIGGGAFNGCSSLKTIDTSNVTNMGNDAFMNTTSLQELDLSNVKTLGTSVFYGSGIKHISLPKLTTSISSLGQFVRESKVETIEFNEESDAWQNKYTIPSNFALSATQLRSINVGNCTQINQEAFRNCSLLTSIGEQPATPILTKLNGGSNFSGCTNLDHIDISLVNEFPGSAFRYCKHLKNLGNNNTLSVEYIRSHVFRDFGTSEEEGIGELSLPNCRLIESECFKDCYGITKINLGSIEELKYDAFCRCNDLEYITGLDNLTICRQNTFYECKKLKEVEMLNLEQFIDGSNQFYACTGLISVNLPKLKKVGGNQTFRSCRIEGLLNLPLLEDTGGQEAFSGAKIKKINLHNCKKLYQYQFDSNNILEEIDLTSCEQFIGRNTFYGCSALTHIELPALTGDIPYYTFRYCNALTTVTFGNGNIRLTNESMCNNPELKTINLDHCIYIGDYALCENPKLETIGSFSNELTYIGREAFRNDNKLTGNITIPASVETIGYRAFYNCGSITSITMEATTPPAMNNESFSGSLAYPIYVPADSVDTYKAANNWRNIASRIFAAS